MTRLAAWLQVFASFALGSWTLLASIGVRFITIDYGALTPATVSAQNLLMVALLVPTMSFVSSLVWLFWDGRRRAQPAMEPQEIRRAYFGETTESIVSAIVASIMLVLGLALLYAAPFSLPLLVVAAGMIGIRIMVLLLEV